MSKNTKSFIASIATIISMGCSIVLIALGAIVYGTALWVIGSLLYIPFLRRI